MGNITEAHYMKRILECGIQKLNKDSYVIPSTGELKKSEHTETRAENLTSIFQSSANLRNLLNTSTTDISRRLWVTLTYKENMQDSKRLYRDFRRFHVRMLYYLKKHSLLTYEYIVAMEPQGRGAWHVYLVMVFPYKAPFIPSDTLANTQDHDSAKAKPLKDVDNVGLYLTAYLTDMELPDVISPHGKIYGSLKAVSVVDEQGNEQTKAIVKDARLKLYPPGFRIYRTSRGVKKSEVVNCIEAEVIKEVGSAPLTSERTIRIVDDNGKGFDIISYRQFSKTQKAVQLDPN